MVLIFFTCMKVYFSYLYLHCLKSLIFLAEPSLTIYYFGRICRNTIHQKYTELSLNLSLNITGHVNLIISAYNKTNSFTEKQDSRTKLPPVIPPKPKEFMLVILNFISNSKYLQQFWFYSSIKIPQTYTSSLCIFWVCYKLRHS